ncbi:MAG: DNA/RNA nuclease SfsA [Bacillota bacterium]|nr:DNA/RNA nuclease SfsA [Bacillota bacterium]
MFYKNIKEGRFLERPNRFIAKIEINGSIESCHVKNTGRCKELLIPGAKVLLEECSSPQRKTKYDLISVWKGERLINMDSAAPNQVFGEWLRDGRLFPDAREIKAEKSHGDSRFDFFVETSTAQAFIEVKGVTLEKEGVARFPDAPTERGLKHLYSLIRCVEEGFQAYAAFVIQMQGIRYFEANRQTHPAFAEALRKAAAAGVQVMAWDCRVTEKSLCLNEAVEVHL